jgi:integrase
MPKKREYTIREYAKVYVLSASTPDTVVRRRSGVARLVEDFGNRPLDGGLTDPEARSWAPRHRGDVRYAKALFTAAVDDEVCGKNPFRRCKQPPHSRRVEVPSVAKVLEAAEAALDLPVFGREMRSLVLAAAGSGLRVSELCNLEVRDVVEVPDFRLEVRDGKGGVDRTACVFEPFGGSVVEDAIRERMRSEHYAGGSLAKVGRLWLRPPSENPARESPFLTRHDVGKLWAGKTGKPGLRDRVGLSSCRWHDLRHFHATWLLDQGNSAEDVAVQLLGHPDPTLVSRTYGHPSQERARQRLRAKVAGDA